MPRHEKTDGDSRVQQSSRPMARESEMLRLRDVEGLTLREIGERYGITAERVRQVVNRYRNSLQNPDPAAGRRASPRPDEQADQNH